MMGGKYGGWVVTNVGWYMVIHNTVKNCVLSWTRLNMERVKIFETDSSIIMARKIYNHFTVGQSCTIGGFTDRTDVVEPVGDIVWQFIREMDYEENYVREPGRAPRRKYREAPSGAIGGRYAHKIFRKKHEVRKTGLVTHIWRVQ